MISTLTTAKLLREQGIATVPIKAGDKTPLVPWKPYQQRLPDDAELSKWFTRPTNRIALVAGGSAGVLCLDFDEKYARGILGRFALRAEEVGLDHLVGSLLRQRTPSGGYHLVARAAGKVIGNEKLACRPPTTQELESNAHAREFVMIETRYEGGYFVIAPSDGYTLETGDWSSIPTISEEDRDALLDLARTFDERRPVETEEPADCRQAPAGEVTPGDDYDARADVPALLKAHGWKPAGSSGKYWTRPGKAKGISATWDVVPGRFFVFTSSSEFTPNHVFRPWHIYAVLECGGDYSRAASELRRQGFGGVSRKKAREILPWDLVPDAEPPGVEQSPDDPPGVEGLDPHGNAPTNETEDDRIRRLLRARAFDGTKTPPPIRPIYELGGVVISTPGNLTAITAQAKVGKSALVSALTASAMTPPESEADTLTAVGYNASGKALLYFDTEQSPDDFWHAVNRAKRRAKLDEIPIWLQAYTVADLPAQIGRKAIAVAMADAAEQFGGIHSVIIDGVADLVLDVNDAEECNGIVAELHSQAIRYDTAILTVIHKNPGSDKVRGHLGSQIERKAETNLSLEKDGDVTVVWSSKQRRAPIYKEKGPRFRWDDDKGMHVTTQDVSKPAAKVMQFLELAQSVMQPGQAMTWKQLVGALIEARRAPDGSAPSSKTAQRWIESMKSAEILSVYQGSYRLSEAAKN
jgi:hypothetical protein